MKLYRYHSKHGSHIAVIVTKGRKYITYVTMGTVPIAKRRVKLAELRHFKEVSYEGNFAAKILDCGTRLGITGGAHKALCAFSNAYTEPTVEEN